MQETWPPSASLSRPNVSSMAAGAWPVEGEPQPQVRDPLWRTAHAPFFFLPPSRFRSALVRMHICLDPRNRHPLFVP